MERQTSIIYHPRRVGEPALAAVSGAMAASAGRGAVAGFGQFAVGADAGLGMKAPKQAVVGARNGRVVVREDEQPFPAQCGAEIGSIGIEAIGFRAGSLGNHAVPPEAAFRMARLTATRASWILYAL